MVLFWIAFPCLGMGAMWQMQIFWGFTPDHECINNGTDYILKPCGTENGTSCDYVMHSSYVTDFGLFCNDAKYLKFMQSAMLFGSFFGELLLGSLQVTAHYVLEIFSEKSRTSLILVVVLTVEIHVLSRL